MIRLLAVVLLCVAAPLVATAQTTRGQSTERCSDNPGNGEIPVYNSTSGQCEWTDHPYELHFAIPAPSASAVNQAARISTARTGVAFSCIARGGTSTDLIVALRECTASGGTTCATVLSGNIELDAVDTLVTGTVTDTAWAAGSHMEVDIVSVGTAPEALYCSATAR